MSKLDTVVSGLRQILATLGDLDEKTDGVENAGATLDALGERSYRATSKFVEGHKKLSKFMTEEQTNINNVTGALKDFSGAMQSSIIGKLAESIPVVGGAVTAFKAMNDAAVKFADGYSKIISDADSFFETT